MVFPHCGGAKKDGGIRLCIEDYHRLNSVTSGDAYPMPRIDEVIDKLGGVTWPRWTSLVATGRYQLRSVEAVLIQVDREGHDHPIAYFSRKLLPREVRYSTVEKECLAIRLGLQAFRVYLLGWPFTVQTDHRALQWLDRLKESSARLMRWSLALQEFDFWVETPS